MVCCTPDLPEGASERSRAIAGLQGTLRVRRGSSISVRPAGRGQPRRQVRRGDGQFSAAAVQCRMVVSSCRRSSCSYCAAVAFPVALACGLVAGSLISSVTPTPDPCPTRSRTSRSRTVGPDPPEWPGALLRLTLRRRRAAASASGCPWRANRHGDGRQAISLAVRQLQRCLTPLAQTCPAFVCFVCRGPP